MPEHWRYAVRGRTLKTMTAAGVLTEGDVDRGAPADPRDLTAWACCAYSREHDSVCELEPFPHEDHCGVTPVWHRAGTDGAQWASSASGVELRPIRFTESAGRMHRRGAFPT